MHTHNETIVDQFTRQAEALAAEKNLANVSFRAGDVNALPFDAGSFSIVTSRYAFHHFTEPARVLREMTRVCAPGGCVAVMDMVADDDPVRAARFNKMETLRDPSHAGALTHALMLQCFTDAGLPVPTVTASVEDDGMGVGTHAKDGRVYFSYPIAIFASRTLGTI